MRGDVAVLASTRGERCLGKERFAVFTDGPPSLPPVAKLRNNANDATGAPGRQSLKLSFKR
jgi:hypothetical protein